MTIDIAKLQASVGSAVDGVPGVVTYTMLFRKCGAPADRAADLAVCANRYFVDYGMMDSPLRLAHFLAQLIHESGSFHLMEEIASGSAYEGRKDLGNFHVGDGVLFKGRGPLQLTGRANYRKFGRRIGIDLEQHPLIASLPSIGLHVALEYWKERDLNALADRDDVEGITRRVNGGLNGFEERKVHLARVKGWLL